MKELTADQWQARAALCELLAFSFRYPDATTAEVIASGEWADAADEIAGVLDVAFDAGAAPGAAEAAENQDPADLLKALRPEATRLFVGVPEAVTSPYEGVWRAKQEGVQALLFVNPHSMEVERFCRSCGMGRPEGTNEPLDHVATELELLQYLALRAALDTMAEDPEVAEAIDAPDPDDAEPVEPGQAPADAEPTLDDEGAMGDEVPSESLPGGSPAAAYEQFMEGHLATYADDFADAVIAETQAPFYAQAAALLKAFVDRR